MSLPTSPDEVRALLGRLRYLSSSASNDAEARAVARQISQISREYRLKHGIGLPASPVAQAVELDEGYRRRPHLDYLSERIRVAVRDVERGQNRMLAVSMPPRMGKSTLLSQQTPLWLLRRHPEWSIITASHDGTLTGEWARSIRQTIENKPTLGVAISPDGGAGTRWSTDEGGGLFATSVQGPITGRGARVMVIDDPVKDFVDAHSEVHRERLWNWWLSVAQTRLEPPYLVLVVMTRWHEDDFIGRLLSPEHEGNPKAWEYIRLGAIAGENDILDRPEGDPLYSPLMDETRAEALDRWADTRRSVGTYTWSALYQQTPSPARGAIFDSAWWRFWTRDPEKVTEDGRVVYLEPSELTGGHWLDSWDCAFKSSPKDANSGGWVVGQRWVRSAANRYLIAQVRGRWSFTQTIAQMQRWAVTDNPGISPCGHLVHERHIEERANGAAIIDTLKDHLSGIKAINPTISKEARARAVTPEIESGHVYLPHPSDPGNEWVQDLLSELRNFPHDMADDQVDALTQGLNGLRNSGRGGVTVPGRNPGQRLATMGAPRNIARAAMTDRRTAGRRAGGM